jgi:hypothetical protein
VPIEFVLFALVLAGVALFHRHTMPIALGARWSSPSTRCCSRRSHRRRHPGLGLHLQHEWVILVNLLLLLLGFALLADLFEKSQVPAALPTTCPTTGKAASSCSWLVFVLSSFLDNIAAAMIGGAVAHTVFRGKVHIGYLAAIVAASNGGGAGSVVGDTTTTMMWIAGVHPLEVLEGFIGSAVALVVFGIPAAFQQQRHSPIVKDRRAGAAHRLRAGRDRRLRPDRRDRGEHRHQHPLQRRRRPLPLPRRGRLSGDRRAARCCARRAGRSCRARSRARSSCSPLVLCASMMPVERLPVASWQTALGLGFLSAVFDNIPLTALALKQGGYDWGFLAYAVGFGGSMIWFGSSAGVALTNMYPEAKSVGSGCATAGPSPSLT